LLLSARQCSLVEHWGARQPGRRLRTDTKRAVQDKPVLDRSPLLIHQQRPLYRISANMVQRCSADWVISRFLPIGGYYCPQRPVRRCHKGTTGS
jgi:hypothetical protein